MDGRGNLESLKKGSRRFTKPLSLARSSASRRSGGPALQDE